ncbi:MAG: bifunctional molybdenum cofactor biosynthesis protein MoaC/MoaB [Armatimonadota bacterium]|nr:bifunctional molybdenum cofactor biosynthesis protein MoaC/MoaB [Armatimonadota bacterium]MCX7777345.1 bifunctional molybdenum cofactor biosynthesis protein MoaC/MoaB [Armatimonadota bacterium]MDW8025387.1 bifunctional molybdenum cofactor biosynthesis protein MoaC/MoaB [Armatimonadota bacterium]
MGMVDISNKIRTHRTAVAEAFVKASNRAVEMAFTGKLPKGEAISVAKVSAIQAAKMTSSLIPYCHQVRLTNIDVSFESADEGIRVIASASAIDRTGVEMEALVAAAVAALTLYDMLKSVEAGIEICSIKLVSKFGGISDFSEPLERQLRAGVVVISDSVYCGRRSDTSGVSIVNRLSELGMNVVHYSVLPDDEERIANELIRLCDQEMLDIVFTTGGTGIGPRDRTPEATANVIERELEGVAEAMRSYGIERTPLASLSRAKVGVRGSTIIINLPGSERAVNESLNAILPWVLHAITMLTGEHSKLHSP